MVNKDKILNVYARKRYVGFLDIMGFKDMVARSNSQRIYEMMRKVNNSINRTTKYFASDIDNKSKSKVLIMTYSDSIMIYSEDDSEDSQVFFLNSIANLSEELFTQEIPFKGAVAFGNMTIDLVNSIYFGQPLIDAYELQNELNFYGIVVHSSAEFRNQFTDDELIVQYDCPFKTGIARHSTVAPIMFGLDNFINTDYIKLIKSVERLRKGTSGAIRKYIDNTLLYLEQVKKSTLLRIENERPPDSVKKSVQI